jgi:hypothetical protein
MERNVGQFANEGSQDFMKRWDLWVKLCSKAMDVNLDGVFVDMAGDDKVRVAVQTSTKRVHLVDELSAFPSAAFIGKLMLCLDKA